MGGNRELAERFIASLEARDWRPGRAAASGRGLRDPQSRERIRDATLPAVHQEYPGDWHLRPKSSSPTSGTGWCGSSGA